MLVASSHDAVHVGYGSPYGQADTLGGVGAPSLLFLTAKAKLVSQETREVREGKDNILIGFDGFLLPGLPSGPFALGTQQSRSSPKPPRQFGCR